jgi:RHS repeat-associated protein
MTDAKGQVFNYSYDALDRLTLADAPGTSDDVIYVYDTCENGAGKLCSVNRDVVTVSYGYTSFGDIKSSTQAVTTFPSYEQAMSQMSYRYDAVGRIQDMVYPGGNKVTYTYDAAGNVYNVILNEGEKNLVTAALYYPFGPERFVTRDNGSSIFGYMDQAYRSFITGHGGYFYDVINYDANGNPETFYSSEGSKDHGYDALDRLDTSSGPYGSRDYGYDINGNRTSKQVDSVTNSYSYDTNTNRMNTNAGSSVLLDANGNTRNIGGMTISYTSDNRVSNISDNAFYNYNGYGERTMKALLDNGAAGIYGFKHRTVYVYGLGGKLLAETGSSGRVKQEYVYLNDELLATIVYEPNGGESILNADMDNDGAIGVDDFMIWYFNHYNTGDVSRDVNEDGHIDMNDVYLVQNCALSGGTAAGCATSSYNRSVYYAHNDHLGTPHMLSDETGVAVWSAVYDPFGKATVNEDLDADGNNVTLNIRFPGQYYDIESGLHYNYFRYYDPETGRYITSDPIGLNGGLNMYGYVGVNPLRWIDPLGLSPYLVGRPLQGGIGSYAGHLYNVTDAAYIGDPNASVYSYGRSNASKRHGRNTIQGLTGIVDENTTGLSSNTHAADIQHWKSLGGVSCSVESPYASPIPASDADVNYWANRVKPTTRYMLPFPIIGRMDAVNSNSVAQAIANKASDISVSQPQGPVYGYPGAGQSSRVIFK